MNWLQHLIRTPVPSADTTDGLTERPIPDMAELARRRLAWQNALGTTTEAELSAASELGLALAQRAEMPLPDDAQPVWVAAICHCTNLQLALDWLDTLTSEESRAAIALHAKIAEVRLTAVRSLSSPDILEKLARDARHHDKLVYQHCTDTLRQFKEARALEQRAEVLLAAFTQLMQAEPISISRLLELEKELGALPHDATELEHCRQLCRQANELVRTQAESLIDLPRLAEAIKPLLTSLGPDLCTWNDHARVQEWLNQFAPLQQRWLALPRWARQQTSARALLADFTFLAEQSAHLQADLEQIPQLQDFFLSLEGPNAPSRDQAQQTWEQLPALHTPFWHAAVQAHFTQWLSSQTDSAKPQPQTAPNPAPEAEAPTLDATEAHPDNVNAGAEAKRSKARSKDNTEKLRVTLVQIEQALDNGQFVRAESLSQRWKTLSQEQDLPKALESQWQRAQARLTGLRSWARWGAAKQREQLIEMANDLILNPKDLDHLAVAVPSLRDAWKQLNAQGNASKPQWELFDKTLTQAFEPVLVFRAAQVAQREQNKAQKQALLNDWEAWFQAIDWTHAKLDELDVQMQQRMDAWRKAPISGFREERLFRKKIEAMRTALNHKLELARQTEVARRRTLIEQATALVSTTHINKAIVDIKTLQGQWRSPEGTVRLLRGTEQKMWREFRSLCDAVFARRDTERTQKQAERKGVQEQVGNLLINLTQAMDSAADSASTQEALSQFNAAWSALRAEHPDISPRQSQQADALRVQAQTKLAQFKRHQKRQVWEQRIQAAPSAAELTPVQAEHVRKQRDEYLLDLEITLGLPSPESQSIARRVRQMAQLQGRFRGNAPGTLSAEDTLRHCCDLPTLDEPLAQKRLQVIIDRWLAREETPVRQTAPASSERPRSDRNGVANRRPAGNRGPARRQ